MNFNNELNRIKELAGIQSSKPVNEGIPPQLEMVDKLSKDGFTAKIYKDTVNNQFIAKFFDNGIYSGDEYDLEDDDMNSVIAYAKRSLGDVSKSDIDQLRTYLESNDLYEGLKLKNKFEHENKQAKVYYDNEWDEFRVKFYTNGKYDGQDSDYFCDDLDDAVSTASSWVKK
jgi:hypothetical protein